MLDNYKPLDFVSSNSIGTCVDWISRRAETQHEFQMLLFLFEDDNVVTSNKCYDAVSLMPICRKQTCAFGLSGNVFASQPLLAINGVVM